jgi:hypothetical protein
VHLEDKFSRYNDVKVNDLLDYLFTAYGTITSTDLIANNQIFDQDWDTLRPFQTVLTQIKQCCDYAADRDQPYTDKQILPKLHAVVFHTGLYHDAFSKHIIHDQNNLQNKKTSKQYGYGMAVEQMQELTQNFVNMITDKWHDKENKANHYLIMCTEIAELNAIISKLQQQPTPKPPACERFPLINNGSYCWLNSFCVAPKPTSKTC